MNQKDTKSCKRKLSTMYNQKLLFVFDLVSKDVHRRFVGWFNRQDRKDKWAKKTTIIILSVTFNIIYVTNVTSNQQGSMLFLNAWFGYPSEEPDRHWNDLGDLGVSLPTPPTVVYVQYLIHTTEGSMWTSSAAVHSWKNAVWKVNILLPQYSIYYISHMSLCLFLCLL